MHFNQKESNVQPSVCACYCALLCRNCREKTRSRIRRTERKIGDCGRGEAVELYCLYSTFFWYVSASSVNMLEWSFITDARNVNALVGSWSSVRMVLRLSDAIVLHGQPSRYCVGKRYPVVAAHYPHSIIKIMIHLQIMWLSTYTRRLFSIALLCSDIHVDLEPLVLSCRTCCMANVSMRIALHAYCCMIFTPPVKLYTCTHGSVRRSVRRSVEGVS